MKVLKRIFKNIRKNLSDITLRDVNRLNNLADVKKKKELAVLLRKIAILDAVADTIKSLAVIIDVILAFTDIIVVKAIAKETVVILIFIIILAAAVKLVVEIMKAKANALLEILKDD